MKPSRSEYLPVRGLRYHLRRWGTESAPPLYILHGLLDVSESFQLVVDAFRDEWNIIAPDWRGCGLTEWPPDGYWFPDYVADLEQIVNHCTGDAPVRMVGHSMGAQIASLYAGLRPARISRLVLLDALSVPDMPPEMAPDRLRHWLKQLADPPQNKTYASFAELAAKVRKHHPKLDAARAEFVARCWGRETGPGRIELLGDPRHRLRGPSLYRVAESIAVWKQVTAPVLCVDADESFFTVNVPAEEKARRRGAFRDLASITVPGASHMLHHDHPAETAAAIEDFIRSA